MRHFHEKDLKQLVMRSCNVENGIYTSAIVLINCQYIPHETQ